MHQQALLLEPTVGKYFQVKSTNHTDYSAHAVSVTMKVGVCLYLWIILCQMCVHMYVALGMVCYSYY